MSKEAVHYGNKNIFSEKQCQLPDGRGRCTACCFVKEVPSLNKPKRTICPYQIDEGCEVHGTDLEPPECRQYYCTDEYESNYLRWELTNRMLSEGKISPRRAEKAKNRWIIP